MQAEFPKIALKDLVPDPNQPRKHFDADKLAELSRSVSQQGVLQPILVRPLKSRNKKYMIVCGERRYRACQNAMLDEIPCVIKDLTDNEALDVQITENLQRENVNPMEEAEAFKAILKTYTTKELAVRIGKKPDYVLQRVKLCDLIPEYQELVFADKMLLTQANIICRFSADVQKSFYDNVPKDWREKPVGWKVRDVHFGNTTHNLDEAPFKTEDPSLNPKMGACGLCKFNSKVSELQFDEFGNSRVCSNPSCYEVKLKTNYARIMAEAAADPEILFVASWGYGQEHEKKLQAAEAHGANVIKEGNWRQLYKPEPPKALPPFEEYVANNEWDEDTTEEDMKADYNSEVEEYESDTKSFEEKLLAYEERKQHTRKAFVVSDHSLEGKIIEVYVPNLASETQSQENVKQRIDELHRKYDGSIKKVEVDYLKNKMAPALEGSNYVRRTDALTDTELMAIFHLLFEKTNWAIAKDIKADFGGGENTGNILNGLKWTEEDVQGKLLKSIRRMLLSALHHDQSFDYNDNGLKVSSFIMRRLLATNVGEEFHLLENNYRETLQKKKDKLSEQVLAVRQTSIPTS